MGRCRAAITAAGACAGETLPGGRYRACGCVDGGDDATSSAVSANLSFSVKWNPIRAAHRSGKPSRGETDARGAVLVLHWIPVPGRLWSLGRLVTVGPFAAHVGAVHSWPSDGTGAERRHPWRVRSGAAG